MNNNDISTTVAPKSGDGSNFAFAMLCLGLAAICSIGFVVHFAMKCFKAHCECKNRVQEQNHQTQRQQQPTNNIQQEFWRRGPIWEQTNQVPVPREAKLQEVVVPKTLEAEIECVICMESTSKVIQLACSHQFHGNCINKWFIQAKSCPVCRSTVH